MVFPLPDESEWHNPGNLPKLKPPVMKRQAGRPKNKDRFMSKNEEPKPKQCGRCGCKSHTREACMQPLPRSDKGKGLSDPCGGRAQPLTKSNTGKAVVDSVGSRKRKTVNEATRVEPMTDLYAEYFENGRIYQDWDDEQYFQNGRIYQDWDDLDWGGEASTSGTNLNLNSFPEDLNSYPQAYNPYHLDDF